MLFGCFFSSTIFVLNAAPIFCVFFFFFFSCCADQKSWKNQLWFSFFSFLFCCCCFCLHSKRRVCLFLLLFRCFFCFLFLFFFSCRPLFFPIFYITTPFIISFAKHSHIFAISLALCPFLFSFASKYVCVRVYACCVYLYIHTSHILSAGLLYLLRYIM